MHHVIYVPGLGDDYNDQGQRRAIKRWQRFGVETHFYEMHWRKGAFDEKFTGLLKLIDQLASSGRVSLVGISAGASAVLLAYAARPDKIAGVVTICGKIHRPEGMNSRDFLENPAFKESLERLQPVLPKLDLSRILNVRPLWDGRVPAADAFIHGAAQKILPTIGHVLSIAVAITLYRSSIMRFLKSQVR